MRLQRRGGELALDERDYKVEVDDGTTRYASVKSGTIVEVVGRSIAIQRTFLVEVQPTTPFVDM